MVRTKHLPSGEKTGTIVAIGTDSITIPFKRFPRKPLVWFADHKDHPNPCDPNAHIDTVEILVQKVKKTHHKHKWSLKIMWDISEGKTRKIHWRVDVIDRFVGFSGKNIKWISYNDTDDRKCIEVPEDLEPVSDEQLLRDYVVRDSKIVSRYSKPANVAVISVYNINCGIATYTKYLCDALAPLVTNLKIFAEHASRDKKTEQDEPYVHRCWNRYDDDFAELQNELDKFNPDLVIIQHEFGIFHQINVWNSLMGQLSKWRTVVTFHTVLDHDVTDEIARLDYTTRSLAEAPCPEIIVHTPLARKPLRGRGYSGRIHYIPHGCFAPDRSPRLPSTKYNMFPKYSIFQYGFGGTHKGWEFAIDTVEILKNKYPDILYVGMFNTIEPNMKSKYFQSLLDLIRKKNLLKNVALQKGYQTEEMLRNYIRSCRVCIFPYQRPNPHWASWGASGAIQLPISLGCPLVLSNYPSFMEFEGRLPLVNTASEAAEVIDKIFSDPLYEKEMSDTCFSISEERNWDIVAQWYLSTNPNEDFNALSV